MAIANARIGVARSAWFPTLTLSAQGGYQSNVPNLFWAIGPSLVGTLLDGGLRNEKKGKKGDRFIFLKSI